MRLVITKRGQKRIASSREYLEDNFYPEYGRCPIRRPGIVQRDRNFTRNPANRAAQRSAARGAVGREKPS